MTNARINYVKNKAAKEAITELLLQISELNNITDIKSTVLAHQRNYAEMEKWWFVQTRTAEKSKSEVKEK